MANTFAPFGFKWRRGTGSAPTNEQSFRRIWAGNTIPIYTGDAVRPDLLNKGYLEQYIQTAAPHMRVEGIFVGCKYFSTSQRRTVWSSWWPGADATGDVEAYVIDDPHAQFTVQAFGNVAQVNVGEFIDVTLGAGAGGRTDGNALSGMSKMSVDAAKRATEGTLPFQIKALVREPPGSNGTFIGQDGNYVVVAFNNASTRTNGASVGIA